MKPSRAVAPAVALLYLWAAHAPARPASPPELHLAATPIRSHRLLAMSMDADGCIWAGSIHRVLHRYDPRSVEVETIELPFDAVVCSCVCVGEKVYILGQSYPRLIIYNRRTKQFSEAAYPSASPDVWYGTEPVDGRHLFLFDRGGAGVIRWDTRKDTGQAVPWPHEAPLPSGGRFERRDNGLWCQSFDFTGGQYVPVGMARLDVATLKFTDWFEYPKDDAGLAPYDDPDGMFFVPLTLKGKLIPFDFKARRWCRFIDVPEFGRRFGFIGAASVYDGRWYFSLSTYNGTDTGCDGRPYHFCNALLEFDPRRRSLEFLALEAKDAYYQVAYTLSAGGDFFATGTNIREPDGRLNRDRAGEVVFWQTLRPVPK